MARNTNSFFKKFLASRDGNISALAAVGMLMVVTAISVAVDSTRLMQASSKLKSLNDMAALAATAGQNKTLEERKAIYESIMEMGITSSDEITGYEYNLTFTDDSQTQILSVTSNSEAELFFPMTRGEGRRVTAHSEVTVGREFIEISLVLDISSSMVGDRILELKKSAKEFVETMLDNEDIKGRVSIALVPFGGSVKLPSDFEKLLIPPATTSHWIDNKWNGCLSMSSIDYASGITPQHMLDYMPDFYAWVNPWCPLTGNEMIGLSVDKTALTDRIDSFSLSDGTATDIGVTWGLAMLDPRWRQKMAGVNFRSPRNFNPRTKKIMIVMADGGTTSQRMPLASEMTGSLPYKTNNEVNTTSEAENGYTGVCDLTKTKGIEIYTVGFLITDPVRLERLQSCGTDTEYNFEAASGELGNAFLGIAASISGARLSR